MQGHEERLRLSSRRKLCIPVPELDLLWLSKAVVGVKEKDKVAVLERVRRRRGVSTMIDNCAEYGQDRTTSHILIECEVLATFLRFETTVVVMLTASTLLQVLRVVNLDCEYDMDPAWALEVLQVAAPTLEQLSLWNIHSEHLRVIFFDMPKLKKLCFDLDTTQPAAGPASAVCRADQEYKTCSRESTDFWVKIFSRATVMIVKEDI